MSFFERFKNAKEKVLWLLEEYKHLRDDDFKLTATFYMHECGGKENLQNMSAYDFLEKFSKGELTNPENIRRNRSIIQSEREDLRGTKFDERQLRGGEVGKKINE